MSSRVILGPCGGALAHVFRESSASSTTLFFAADDKKNAAPFLQNQGFECIYAKFTHILSKFWPPGSLAGGRTEPSAPRAGPHPVPEAKYNPGVKPF